MRGLLIATALCLSFFACPGYAFSTLTLKDVLSSTQKHFPLIAAAEQSIIMAHGQLQIAKGAFDPAIHSQLRGTPSGGYENVYDDNTVSQPLPFANSEVYARYRIGRGDWPSYYQNYLTNDNGEFDLGVAFSLLRDFSIDPRRAGLQTAKLNVLLQTEKTRRIKIDTYREAGMAYWRWVAAAKKMQLIRRLLHLAQLRQKALIRSHRLGDAAQIEVVENQRFILQRSASLIEAKLIYKQATEFLSLYYRNKKGHPLIARINQVPKQLPIILKNKDLNAQQQQLFKLMMKHNPALSVLKHKTDIQIIHYKLARNELLPKLDATASTEQQYGDDGDPLLTRRAYNLGLKFSVDFPRNIAKGRTLKARAKIFALQQQLTFAKQQLKVEFVNEFNQLENDRQQVEILNNELKLAKKIERAEVVKFKEGDSSLFLVNQREQTTFTTQLDALDATITYYLSRLNINALCAFANTSFKVH